ncbi:MAG: TIR domain-containing protein [Ruminococcaceae bacterium]|nr:TIR domain-containing protein [Oscillospiraceae bacterium]
MYDIFISYRRDGGHEMARLLYEHFRMKGLRCFFDLEELGAGEFNVKLLDSIEASKNFVLILSPNALERCLNEGDWVRCEIEHAIKHGKNIVPLMLSGFSWPENLPESLAKLPFYNGVFLVREYFDASLSKLIDLLVLDSATKAKATGTAPATAKAGVASWLERAFIFLEDGEWKKADTYAEKALDADPKNGEAYLVKLMVELQVEKRENLANLEEVFDSASAYKMLVRYASDALKKEIAGYIDHIRATNAQKIEDAYQAAIEALSKAKNKEDCQIAASLFAKLVGYKDSAAREKECFAQATAFENEEKYIQAETLEKQGTAESLFQASKAFANLAGYRDSTNRAEVCFARAEEIENEEKYDAAETLMTEGTIESFEKAIAVFSILGDYRDSAQKKEECRELLEKRRKKLTKTGLIVAFLVAVCICIFCIVSVQIQKHPQYKKLQDGTYELTDIRNFEGDVFEIPATHRGAPVTSIGAFAFYGCDSLASITIPDSVTSIGSYAFSGCSSIISITIPDGVTSIGKSAFSGCSSITSITIPDGVTSIGNSAFSGCTGLVSVTIPDSVTSIGEAAFYSCSGLTTITVPDSVTSIGAGAFDCCANLESITLPFVGASKDGTDNAHFGYVFGASSYKFNDKRVPRLLETVVITGGSSIAAHAFAWCDNLISIAIPDGVTSIGEYAFYNCSDLTAITVPDSVTSIGAGAFDCCANLESITLPFVGTSKDGTDNAHFGYVFAASSSFDNGDTVPASLKTVVITGGSSIDAHAFAWCENLISITIPDSVTSIGASAFLDCTSLSSITIPDSVTSIEHSAFSGCESLTSVTIPDSVTSIGESAFSGCAGLTSVTIPDSVLKTGFCSVFGHNLSISIVTISDSVTSIGEVAFENCSSLTNILLPDGVTSIGNSAFSGCTGLTSITIPDGITSIGRFLFHRCKVLASVTIPGSVTNLGDYAFNGCTELTSVTYHGTKAEWNAISKGYHWKNLTNGFTVTCTDGIVEE